MNFIETINSIKIILTEGAIIERLKREFNYSLDEVLSNASMIYDEDGKILLEKLYREYIDIAVNSGFPIMLLTPTWRANKKRTKKAKVDTIKINTDAFKFVDTIRISYKGFAEKIFIGGLTGCKGDAYKPKEALDENEAYLFHKDQINALTAAGVDFLFASTMPEINEVKGMAKAMSETNLPYVISFVIRDDGKMLDGTSLVDAIKIVDDSVLVQPVFYMTNCIHPDVLNKSLNKIIDDENILAKRLFGIQANASDKSPEELDTLDELHADSPQNWAKGMVDLNKKYNLKVLGGCCGTDARYISSIVDLLKLTP